jgi:tetratricopeptide (TPR) repeat protein
LAAAGLLSACLAAIGCRPGPESGPPGPPRAEPAAELLEEEAADPLSPEERAEAAFLAAAEAESSGDFKTAADLYRRAAAANPATRGLCLARLGRALIVSGRTDEGLSCLAEAEAAGVRSPSLYRVLAGQHLAAGRKDEAAKAFEKMLAAADTLDSLELRETDVLRSATFLISLYQSQDRPADAARIYGHLVRFFPEWAEFHREYAKLCLAAGDEAGARREVAVYEKLVPTSAAGARMLAAYFSRKGDAAEALAETERALERMRRAPAAAQIPGDLSAMRLFKADLLGRLKRFDAARRELDELMAAAADLGEKVDVLVAGADLDREEGKSAEAAKRLRAAIDGGLQSARLHGALAEALSETGDRRGAIEALRSAEEIAPRDNFYRMALARLYARGGQRAEAAAELRVALSASPDNAEALNMLGYLYAEEGINLEEAADMAARALAAEKDNGHFMDSLGWVRYRQGRAREALPLLERAAMLSPEPAIYDHLGDACYALGLFRRARAAWLKSKELDKDRPGVEHKLGRRGIGR